VADSPERFSQAVGRRIAELRRMRAWTQQDLADRMRIDVSAVQRLERGAHAATLHTVWRVARALRVDPVQLLVPPDARAPRPGRPPKLETAEEEEVLAVVQRRQEPADARPGARGKPRLTRGRRHAKA
jgi:transcriptional regulator with XRE-family HTH domain